MSKSKAEKEEVQTIKDYLQLNPFTYIEKLRSFNGTPVFFNNKPELFEIESVKKHIKNPQFLRFSISCRDNEGGYLFVEFKNDQAIAIGLIIGQNIKKLKIPKYTSPLDLAITFRKQKTGEYKSLNKQFVVNKIDNLWIVMDIKNGKSLGKVMHFSDSKYLIKYHLNVLSGLVKS